MKAYPAEHLAAIGRRLFEACGAPASEAAQVVDHLLEASLMGLESHGVTRYVMYADACRSGDIRPGAPVRVERETPTLAVVDCGMNFGQVGAGRVLDLACAKARESGLAFAVSRHCHHVGRLGAYPQRAAEQGLFCLAVANSHKHGHFVVPWGGRQGRLATNPLAFAAPAAPHPVLLDMSTSMIPEGKIRALMHAGEPVPEGAILDAEGRPTTDPRAFYGPPRGAILPFGSHLGFRGFGLGLLVEILGSTIAGEALGDELTYVNGIGVLVLDPEPLCGAARFRHLVEELVAYVTGSPPAPGFAEVMVPGAREFRTRDRRLREGIPLPEETCRQIREVGARAGVEVDL
ncbi:MAG: Ldh family oxidoreductase [Gemmatimonadota bacterium]